MWNISVPRRTSAALALGALVLALALVGCGGGSSQTSTSTTAAAPSSASARTGPATGSTLIARAEAICARVNRAIASGARVGLDLSRIAAAAPRNAVLERAALDQLSRLHPPAALALDWKRLLEYRSRLARELLQLVHAAKRGDLATIRALVASKTLAHAQLRALAVHDGFKACARLG